MVLSPRAYQVLAASQVHMNNLVTCTEDTKARTWTIAHQIWFLTWPQSNGSSINQKGLSKTVCHPEPTKHPAHDIEQKCNHAHICMYPSSPRYSELGCKTKNRQYEAHMAGNLQHSPVRTHTPRPNQRQVRERILIMYR